MTELVTTKRALMDAALRGEGCLGKAADDEPVFLVRAKDRLAAAVVDDWADRAEHASCAPEKVKGARAIAEAMRKYPNRKLPD